MSTLHPSRARTKPFSPLAALGLIVGGWILPGGFDGGVHAADLWEEVTRRAEAELPALEELYRDFHTHPELSFQEERTAGRMAEELRRAGYEVTEGVGGWGVVAVLAQGAGRTLLLRADADALPVEEETGLAYASRARARDDAGQDVPVMHACGHDIHLAALIGTARVMAQMRDRWRGTLVLIVQPAEERGAGARAMLEAGLYRRFPRPEAAIALHVDPTLEAGSVAYVPGYALANVDSVDITIRGVGGHGAYPHTTKDPVVIAAQVILALQTIVSREVPPTEPAVVTVGSIHAGAKHNVIADEARLQLTVRSYSDAVRDQVLTAIERLTRGIALAAGVPERLAPTVVIQKDEYTPSLYNDPALTERLAGLFRELLGEAAVVRGEPQMGGEDFARYGREEPRIPICMFRLGSIASERLAAGRRLGGEPLPSLHSGRYWPDSAPTLKTGVRTMSAAALAFFGSE